MWTTEAAKEGEAVWRGTDSIFNSWIKVQKETWMYGAPVYVVALAAFALGAAYGPFMILVAIFEWRNGVIGILIVASVWGLCVAVTIELFANRDFVLKPPKMFITRTWLLLGTEKGLAYSAGPFDTALDPLEVSRDGTEWIVRLADVARVETSPTANWQGSRRYPRSPSFAEHGTAIPAMEHQVFLFMADGSRRVIQTINGDPESAGTLALSIRSWIDTAKRKVKKISAGSDEGGRRPGYDI